MNISDIIFMGSIQNSEILGTGIYIYAKIMQVRANDEMTPDNTSCNLCAQFIGI